MKHTKEEDFGAIVIELSDLDSEEWSDTEETQIELIHDIYSIDQDRQELILPKVNLQNNFKSKQPSIADIYSRKRQVKLFADRDYQSEVVWQSHVLMSICQDDWTMKKMLRVMFYSALFQQRLIEIKIINIQFTKAMVGFNTDSLKAIYETGVITYNVVNHLSEGKLGKFDKMLLPLKNDGLENLTKKLDKLLFSLEGLIIPIKLNKEFHFIESLAKRLSLVVQNVNKIVVQLYVSILYAL